MVLAGLGQQCHSLIFCKLPLGPRLRASSVPGLSWQIQRLKAFHPLQCWRLMPNCYGNLVSREKESPTFSQLGDFFSVAHSLAIGHLVTDFPNQRKTVFALFTVFQSLNEEGCSRGRKCDLIYPPHLQEGSAWH